MKNLKCPYCKSYYTDSVGMWDDKTEEHFQRTSFSCGRIEDFYKHRHYSHTGKNVTCTRRAHERTFVDKILGRAGSFIYRKPRD